MRRWMRRRRAGPIAAYATSRMRSWAEVPSLVRLDADDLAPPELVERADECALLEIARLRQDVEPEIAAHR